MQHYYDLHFDLLLFDQPLQQSRNSLESFQFSKREIEICVVNIFPPFFCWSSCSLLFSRPRDKMENGTCLLVLNRQEGENKFLVFELWKYFQKFLSMWRLLLSLKLTMYVCMHQILKKTTCMTPESWKKIFFFCPETTTPCILTWKIRVSERESHLRWENVNISNFRVYKKVSSSSLFLSSSPI